MLIELSKLDVAPEGKRMLDNDLNPAQARRILESIGRIRKMEGAKVYFKDFGELESRITRLIRALEEKDPDAQKYSDEAYRACFSCHAKHRSIYP